MNKITPANLLHGEIIKINNKLSNAAKACEKLAEQADKQPGMKVTTDGMAVILRTLAKYLLGGEFK